MFSSVDLPAPEGPTIATNSPGSIRSVTPRSALTRSPEDAYSRPTSTSSMSGCRLT